MAAVAGVVGLCRAKLSEVRWLVVSAFALIFFSLAISLDVPVRLVSHLVGNRYFSAPNALLGLALVAWVFQVQPVKKWARAVGIAVLILLSLVGVSEYFNIDPLFFEGPSWRAEIRAWRADLPAGQAGSTHVFRVWPRPWTWEVPPSF